MGKRHAVNFLSVQRAEVVAAFSPEESERAWAQENLVPWGVKIYSSYDEMIAHPDLEAICIATVTAVHADEAIKAISKGLHVLCEKPLSTTVEVSRLVVDAAAKRPDLKVLCGFSRRFDASYRNAFAHVESGNIGRPCIVKSSTQDKHDPSGFFVQYAKHSGGIFVDCNVHDIDLAFWFLGEDLIPKSVTAYGITAIEPELQKYGDVDNAMGMVEFHGGKMAMFGSSRLMAAGQHDETEITGTKGKVTVNVNPKQNLVEFHASDGIRREIPQTYWDRFREAFKREAEEFVDCCLDGKTLPFKLEGALRAVMIGTALQESLRTGKMIRFDETGTRLEDSKL
jgi:myo-inositol 2-dehydrogenase/D-chiro-inositol 1-dehydrogenase